MSAFLNDLDIAHRLLQESCGKKLLDETSQVASADITILSHDAVLDQRVKK